MEIVTAKVKIRNWQKTDILSLVENANDCNVSLYLRDTFPFPYTQTDGLKWLTEVTLDNNITHFAISINNHAIGGIGLTLQDDVYRYTAELGYWLGINYWGQGIMTDVVSSFVNFCFQEYSLLRIEAKVFAKNLASKRVLEKCNFGLDAILKNNVIKNGQVMDSYLYSLVLNSN